MRGSHEAFWWSLFSAGSVVAALLIPVLIFATALAPGFGWEPFIEALAFDRLRDLLGNELVKVTLLIGVSLSFFHVMHRIRHLMVDLHVVAPRISVAVISYLLATIGSVFGGVFLWRI